MNGPCVELRMTQLFVFRWPRALLLQGIEMNKKLIASALALLGFLWFYLAFESYMRGKMGICLAQSAAGVAFVVRGIYEWRKANRL